MNKRKDVVEFILELEKKFNVNLWKINNIKVWPLIRLKLFLAIISKLEGNENRRINPLKNRGNKILVFIKSIFYIPSLLYFFLCLRSKRFLFFAYDNHRISYHNQSYNRFFDTIINEINLKKDSFIFDFGFKQKNRVSNSDIFFNLENFLNTYFQLKKIHFKFSSKRVSLEGYETFLTFLRANDFTSDLVNLITRDNIIISANDLYIKSKFFEKIILATKSEKIFLLNYYSEKFYALNLACYNLDVESIDMQHGPNAFTHLAYSNWSVVPFDGYAILPKTFWTWDDSSFRTTNTWTSKNNYHNTIQYGNPWVDYFRDNLRDSQKFKKENYVLYSLQPMSLEILFSKNLLTLISKSKYKWYLRLHPNQNKEKQKILNLFKNNDLEHKIVIDQATYDPLPLVLYNSLIHITNFSGCVLEASLLNKFSIILHDIGRDNFKDLINLKKASYINQNELSLDIINECIKNSNTENYISQKNTFYNYFSLIV